MDELHDTASIDDWKRRALALSGSDVSMGSVFSKALDILSTVVRDGLGAPNIHFALDSLKRERAWALELDENKSEPLRAVVYGVNECIGTTIAKLVDQNSKILEQNASLSAENEQLKAHQETQAIDDEKNLGGTGSASFNNVEADLWLTAKQEPQDNEELLETDNQDGSNYYDLLAPKLDDDSFVPADRAEELNENNFESADSNLDDEAMDEEVSEDEGDETEENLSKSSLRRSTRHATKADEVDSDCENEKKERSETKYTCTTCAKVFTYKKSFDNHIKLHRMLQSTLSTLKNKDKSNQPSEKGTNRSRSTLKNKDKSVQPSKKDTKDVIISDRSRKCCPRCTKTFARTDKLNRHILNVHGVMPFACGSCPKRFDKIKELLKHRKQSGHKPTREVLKSTAK